MVQVKLDDKVSVAYEEVRDDKNPINWFILDYVDDKNDILQVTGKGKFYQISGSGGLAELKKNLKETNASFAYLRMVVGNDELSKRAKFVLVSWCGSQVKVMRKAKLSVHIADVKAVIKNFAIEVAAGSLEDLAENQLNLLLKKAMGANYDRQASNY